MMFLRKEKANGIKSFAFNNYIFVYRNKENNLILNNDIKLSERVYEFFVDEQYLFYNEKKDNIKQVHIYDTRSNKDISIEDKFILDIPNNSNQFYIFTHNSNSLATELHLFNLSTFKSEELIKEYDWGLCYLTSERFFIFKEETTLSSLSLLTRIYEWEVDLSIEGLKGGSIFGVSDTNLLVACANEYQGIWLALDVATGKEIWRQHLQSASGGTYVFNEDKTSAIILHTGGFWLNGIQVAKGNNIFREYNTKDGSIKREGVLWQLDEAGLGIHNCTLHEGFIYFTAVYKSFGATVLGVLDYETLFLLWWEEVKMDEADGFGNFFLNQPLQVAENKIYVLDKTHVLHIYERDETIPFEKPTENGLKAFEDLPILEKPTQNEPYYPTEDDIPF